MTLVEYEYRIVKRVRQDMFKATDRDGVNKVYRQARACSYQKYLFLNKKFKEARNEALRIESKGEN